MSETELRELNAAMLKAENRLAALATDRCDKIVLEVQQYTGMAFGRIRAALTYPVTTHLDTGDDDVAPEISNEAVLAIAHNVRHRLSGVSHTGDTAALDGLLDTYYTRRFMREVYREQADEDDTNALKQAREAIDQHVAALIQAAETTPTEQNIIAGAYHIATADNPYDRQLIDNLRGYVRAHHATLLSSTPSDDTP